MAGVPPEDGFVSLKELAVQLGMDRSHARRYLLTLGYVPQKRRTLDSANQLSLTVTAEEARAIIQKRRDQGFLGSGSLVESDRGYFYVIELVPELSQSRLKLGFAVDVQERLGQHRTACPTARVLKHWPCRRTWEQAAIDSVTRVGCELVANEVFDCPEPDALVERADQFFSGMPEPNRRLSLSPSSPLRQSTEQDEGEE